MYVSDLSVHYNESQIFVSLVYIFNFNLSVNTVSSTATPKSSIGKRHRSRFAPSLERFVFFLGVSIGFIGTLNQQIFPLSTRQNDPEGP